MASVCHKPQAKHAHSQIRKVKTLKVLKSPHGKIAESQVSEIYVMVTLKNGYFKYMVTLNIIYLGVVQQDKLYLNVYGNISSRARKFYSLRENMQIICIIIQDVSDEIYTIYFLTIRC